MRNLIVRKIDRDNSDVEIIFNLQTRATMWKNFTSYNVLIINMHTVTRIINDDQQLYVPNVTIILINSTSLAKQESRLKKVSQISARVLTICIISWYFILHLFICGHTSNLAKLRFLLRLTLRSRTSLENWIRSDRVSIRESVSVKCVVV